MASSAQLREENVRLITLVDDQNTRIQQLEELIRTLRHRQFGASSEQVPAEQERLFDEVQAAVEAEPEATAVRGHTRRRSHGRPRLSDDLPRVEVIHDLSEAEKICTEHGCALTPIGEQTSEQLEFIPAEVQVIRHVCKKYTCPQCEGHVVTAKKPPQPIPKSVATPGLLAWIAVSKYVDALPLYRQCAIFDRLGFDIDRTTLANWMIQCGQLLQPLVNLLWDALREQPYVHMDETTVQVLAEPGRTPQSKSYMWVSAAGPPGSAVVLFHYEASRGGGVPRRLLGDYEGALIVDGYEAYDAVCREQGLKRLGCWAHARRKFVEAQRLQPKGKTGKSDQALSLIGKLYRIERTLKDQDTATRLRERQDQAQPVIDKLRAWLDRSLPRTAPSTALGKALTYLDRQWPRLIGYLDDGAYPIDNNRAENAIRPFVIGRKNWLFSQSTRGAAASANLYSLIETAKANGLEPCAYLRHIFTQLPKAQNVEDISALLPGKYNPGD
jgi:transposase